MWCWNDSFDDTESNVFLFFTFCPLNSHWGPLFTYIHILLMPHDHSLVHYLPKNFFHGPTLALPYPSQCDDLIAPEVYQASQRFHGVPTTCKSCPVYSTLFSLCLGCTLCLVSTNGTRQKWEVVTSESRHQKGGTTHFTCFFFLTFPHAISEGNRTVSCSVENFALSRDLLSTELCPQPCEQSIYIFLIFKMIKSINTCSSVLSC